MKLFRLTMILAAAIPLAAQPAATLQRAILKETVEGDLKGAIALYQKAVAEAGKDRATAAQAWLHLAQCYEKQGNAEAKAIYERLVRDFADQKDAVAMARARLGPEPSQRNTGPVTRQVLAGPNINTWGSISPDGRYFSYTDYSATHDVMLRDLVTGEIRQLTHEGKTGRGADFTTISPDGRQIAYVWHNGKGWELRLLGLHGNAPATPRVLFYNDDIRYPGPWAWSSDGKWIAVQLQRKDNSVQIGLLAPADGSLRILKSVDWRGAGDMAFSPDAQYLAYSVPPTPESKAKDLMVLSTDGSRESLVLKGTDANNTPAGWTPDGKHLLFTSNRTGVQALWALRWEAGRPEGSARLIVPYIGNVIRITRSGALYYSQESDGTEMYTAQVDLAAGKALASPVPESTGEMGPPRWSPDGKHLAYLYKRSSPTSFSRVRIRSVDNGQSRDLQPSLRYMRSFCWSDDRSMIAGAVGLKGKEGLYRVNIASGAAEPIVLSEIQERGGVISVEQPQCAADGKSSIYGRYIRKPGESRFTELTIVYRDLTSGKEHDLASVDLRTSQVQGFTLSPDGRHAAYAIRDVAAKYTAVKLIPLGAGEPRELLRFNGQETANLGDWTSDSQSLILRKSAGDVSGFWLVPLANGEPREIDLRNSRARALAINPDGRQVAYLVPGTPTKEVLAMENFLSLLSASR